MVIYSFIFKQNASAVGKALLATPPATRRLIEEMTLAVMVATPPGHLQPVAVPTAASVAPIDPEQFPALAHRVRSAADPAVRSKLLRLAVVSMAAHAAVQQFRYLPAIATVDYSARSRLKTLLLQGARTLAFTKYGESYVAFRFRTVLPAWSVATTPQNSRPDTQIDEILQENANDIIRPIIDTKLSAVMATDNPWARAWTWEHFAAAVTTLQEMTEGYPKVLVNEQLVADRDTAVPAIAVTTDFNAGAGHNSIGVTVDNEIYTDANWESPVLDCLYEWIAAADETGHVAPELCDTILRGNTATTLGEYLLNSFSTANEPGRS